MIEILLVAALSVLSFLVGWTMAGHVKWRKPAKPVIEPPRASGPGAWKEPDPAEVGRTFPSPEAVAFMVEEGPDDEGRVIRRVTRYANGSQSTERRDSTFWRRQLGMANSTDHQRIADAYQQRCDAFHDAEFGHMSPRRSFLDVITGRRFR